MPQTPQSEIDEVCVVGLPVAIVIWYSQSGSKKMVNSFNDQRRKLSAVERSDNVNSSLTKTRSAHEVYISPCSPHGYYSQLLEHSCDVSSLLAFALSSGEQRSHLKSATRWAEEIVIAARAHRIGMRVRLSPPLRKV